MDSQKIEDSVLKLASEYFVNEILPYFGIKKKVVAAVPTEMVTLELNRRYMDYTFLTEDEVYHHFEFQSTDGGVEDLQRFHGYEAVLVMKTGKAVITHVIYSGNIKKTLSEYKYGINRYRVDVITLADKDAAKVLERIEGRLRKKKKVTRKECLELILLPLMGGEWTKQEKILRAVKVTKNIENKEAKQMLAMLYAFAEKFLTKTEKKPIEEVILMTELGQMILDRGVEKGHTDIIVKMLEKGFSCEEVSNITEVALEEIERLQAGLSENQKDERITVSI